MLIPRAPGEGGPPLFLLELRGGYSCLGLGLKSWPLESVRRPERESERTSRLKGPSDRVLEGEELKGMS